MDSDVIAVLVVTVLITFGVDGCVMLWAFYKNRKRK
jgi:hypothetical protein